MSISDTDSVRDAMTREINARAVDRAELEEREGRVWDTQELQDEFEVVGFLAPAVMVNRRSDGAQGTMTFQHRPRFYWGFC